MELKDQCVKFREGNKLYLGYFKAGFLRKWQSNTADSFEQDPYWNLIIIIHKIYFFKVAN